jgi:putative membrane protein
MIHVLHLLAYTVAILLAARIVPGIKVKSFTSALFFALVLALLNKLLFLPLLAITLPIVLVTFGIFILFINAGLFWLANKIVKGVEVNGFGAAFWGSLVASLLNWLITWFIR